MKSSFFLHEGGGIANDAVLGSKSAPKNDLAAGGPRPPPPVFPLTLFPTPLIPTTGCTGGGGTQNTAGA